VLGKRLRLARAGIPANAATLALINNTSLLVLTEDGILNVANTGSTIKKAGSNEGNVKVCVYTNAATTFTTPMRATSDETRVFGR
jgi:hypothetical protein